MLLTVVNTMIDVSTHQQKSLDTSLLKNLSRHTKKKILKAFLSQQNHV